MYPRGQGSGSYLTRTPLPVTSCGQRQVTTHPVSHHLAGLPPSVVTLPVAFSTPLSSGHQFAATDLERERRPPLFRLLKVLVTACTRSTDGKVPLLEHGRPGLFSSAVLSEVLLGRGGSHLPYTPGDPRYVSTHHSSCEIDTSSDRRARNLIAIVPSNLEGSPRNLLRHPTQRHVSWTSNCAVGRVSSLWVAFKPWRQQELVRSVSEPEDSKRAHPAGK